MFKRFQILFVVFVLALAGLASFAAADTVLYMSFDKEPDGDVYMDESGNGNDGTILAPDGLKWINDGQSGGAINLDGTCKIEVPHSASLNMEAEMTAEVWLRTEAALKGIFLVYKSHVGDGRNYEWGLYITTDSTNLFYYAVEPADAVVSAGIGGTYNDGNWHFMAGTFDGAVATCYVDGQIKTAEWANPMRASEGSLFIGAWGSFYVGDLDEVRVMNEARTEAQLLADYENGYNVTAVDSADKLSATWAQIKAQ